DLADEKDDAIFQEQFFKRHLAVAVVGPAVTRRARHGHRHGYGPASRNDSRARRFALLLLVRRVLDQARVHVFGVDIHHSVPRCTLRFWIVRAPARSVNAQTARIQVRKPAKISPLAASNANAPRILLPSFSISTFRAARCVRKNSLPPRMRRLPAKRRS